MSQKEFIIDLAKLVVSAAWVDGELANDEINALKDLLFSLEEVSSEDWTILEMYMDSPTTEAEKKELLERVINGIKTSEDKTLALKMLQRLFTCDGKVTLEEETFLEEFKNEISLVGTNILSRFSSALKSAVQRRKETVQSSCLREYDYEDYVKNTIYYELQRKQKDQGISLEKADTEIRKLCLAAGLLARIANVDLDIADEERETMCRIIAEDWDLSHEQAGMLVQISCDRTTKGLDYFRLSLGFFECTTLEERKEFLKTLFRIANATDKTDNEEIEEIRRVAKGLKLSHKDFIDAKLTIPREDRNGL